MASAKYAKDSFNLMTQLIFPYDVNMHRTLMGGKLMYWMDVCAVISAIKHCNSKVVTISVDSLNFKKPIYEGELVHIESIVTRAFRTSMEVKLSVFRQAVGNSERIKSNDAYFTIAAIDEHMKTIPVPAIIPETEEEKKEYQLAEQRRQYRLSNLEK